MTNSILFAAPDDEKGVEDARSFARENLLTQETARIYKSHGQVLVACHKIPESLEDTWLWNWLKTHLE